MKQILSRKEGTTLPSDHFAKNVEPDLDTNCCSVPAAKKLSQRRWASCLFRGGTSYCFRCPVTNNNAEGRNRGSDPPPPEK